MKTSTDITPASLPPVRVNPLVRLWDSRAYTLYRCAEFFTKNKPLKDQLEAMASSYRQCAREFEEPPVALFVELGFDKPNNPGERPENRSEDV